MTQTKTIIVLDNSTLRVFITTIQHNPSDDMEISVDDRLTELGFSLNNCSWMEVADGFTPNDVEIIEE